MLRVRLATADSTNPGNVFNTTVGEVEDGFVIRGVHRQEPGMSTNDVQLRGHSFIGSPAPVYRPRPRPHHLSKESSDAPLAESRKWQRGPANAPRWKVTVQLARLAAHSKLAGQHGVGAAVANQVVAKKWKAVGNMLKATADGVSRIRALVERDKKTYMQAAQEALRLAAVGVLNVKLTVRSEHELQSLSYLQQGDASLYTPEALAKRMAIRSQPKFREAVRAWWQWLPLCTLPPEERITEEEKLMPAEMRGMTKPVYCAMAAIIQRVLLPRFGLKPSPGYDPEDDWKFDCRGKRFLLFPQLLNALFELADMWCPTMAEDDYVTILTELLQQCKALEGRHGLFSKLLAKYQRRFGAQEEQKLPLSGGYVQNFDSAAGRALTQGSGGSSSPNTATTAAEGGETAAAASSASLSASSSSSASSPMKARSMDEADVVLKALSDDDDSEDHRDATNWWAKIMERNRRYLAAKAQGLADEAAEAVAANSTSISGAADSGDGDGGGGAVEASPTTAPIQFPMALLGALYDTPSTLSVTPPSDGAAARRRFTPEGPVTPGAWRSYGKKPAAAGTGTGGTMSPVPPPTPPPPDLQPKMPAPMRMGKIIKGQAAPLPPSAALVATLRDAVTDALVEVGASADATQAASVLTEAGTIAYQQVGPHTLAEFIKVLVNCKRMNTRHIRALIGDKHGSPGNSGSNLSGSIPGSGPGSRKKIVLPTVAEAGKPGTTVPAAAVAAAPVAQTTSPRIVGGGGSGSDVSSPFTTRTGGGSNGGGGGHAGGVISIGAPTAAFHGPGTPPLAAAAAGAAGSSSTIATVDGSSTAATADGDGGATAQYDASDGGAISMNGDGDRGGGDERESNEVLGGDEAGGDGEDGDDGGGHVFAARPRAPCMDAATLCAIRATLQGAGLSPGDLSGMLASHGMGLATDVQPQMLAHVAQVLAQAGFTTEAIVAFLFPPEAEEELEAVGLGLNMPLSEVQLQAMRVALSKAGVDDALVDLVRSWTADIRAIQATSSALEAAGFTPLEVQRFIAPAASTALIDALRRRGLRPAAAASLLRRDGKGLSMDLSPQELAEAADAMASAGFTSEQLVKAIGSDAASVPPLEPAGLDACREALLSEGFTEEELEEVVLTDNGTALQDTIGAATMARVAVALARGGLTGETIRRFLRYDIVRAAKSRLPQRALRAMHSVVSVAVRSGDKSCLAAADDPLLLPDGSGVAPDAGVGVVAQIGGALVEAMFKPAEIRAFLMPTTPEEPEGEGEGGSGGAATASAVEPDPGPLGRGDTAAVGDSAVGGGRAPGGRRQHLSPREIVVFRTVLMASGFATQDLVDVVRPDGRGLDPDADPELAAKAVAAMSAAGFRGHEIQLFLQLRDPAPAMSPSEAAAARTALVTGGFTPSQLGDLLRRDGLGLVSEPEPEPYVMAQVAVVLADAGFPTFHVCQYLAPAMPLVPVKVLAVGRYFGQSVSGILRPSMSMGPVNKVPSFKPWAVVSATEDGRLLPEDDISDDEDNRKEEEAAAAAAALEAAAERRRRQREAEAAAAVAEAAVAAAAAEPPPSLPQQQVDLTDEAASAIAGGDDGGSSQVREPVAAATVAAVGGPADWMTLPPAVLQAMRETVDRRCKGLNTKQLRQLAPQMMDPASAAAVAAAAAVGTAGCSWLPLDADVTARVVRSLSSEGFSPNQIRRFFMQPVLAAAEGGLSEVELFDHVPPPLLFLVRALLKASGFTDQHLTNMLSADRRRLDPDWDVESAAMVVAALARAGFSSHLIRLLLTTSPPVGALTPNELGTIHEALLEAGFSRRQLRLVLRSDHSGPGRHLTDSTTLAQMATALSHAGCSAGQLCQFLGPTPAAFTRPVPLPLLSPLLALINANMQVPTTATSNVSPSTSVTLLSTTAPTATIASSIPPTITFSSMPSSLAGSGPLVVTNSPPPAAAAAATTAATVATAAVLDSRSVMDIRNVAASCGFSSRVLADMIRSDGRGLQRHADPRVIERVGLHMVNQGFTPAQVYRFLLPNGGCEYGQLDPPTSAAIRAVLLAAGFSQADLKTLLINNGTTITATASSAVVAAVAFSLAASGATADQIRHILRPTPGAAVVQPSGSAAIAGGAAAAGGAPSNAAAHPGGGSSGNGDSVSSLAVTILKGLMASGYEDHQLDLILRKDGTALRADVGPLRLAQMVAALTATDIPAATIRMFVRPLGGLQPSVALEMRATLERSPLFDSERVEAAFSPEIYELGPSVEPSTLADIATTLTSAGVNGDVVRQLISLPSGATPQSTQQLPFSFVAGGGEAPTAADASAVAGIVAAVSVPPPPASPPGPLLRGRAAGGAMAGRLVSVLPYAKMLAMREAILARWAESIPNPGELMHDPVKVVVALADAGYPGEEIRAFVSIDPKLVSSPAFLRASGPMPQGAATATGGGGGGNGSGLATAMLGRAGGAAGGMSSGGRMSDPGASRTPIKVRQSPSPSFWPVHDRNAASRFSQLASPGSGPGFEAPVRFTTDGSSMTGAQGSGGDGYSGSTSFLDFEYRLAGEGAAAATGDEMMRLAAESPLTAEQLLAWMAGVRQLMPRGRTERFPPGLENQLATYLRRVLLRLVGNEVLRAAVGEAIGVGTSAAATTSPGGPADGAAPQHTGGIGHTAPEPGGAVIPGRRDTKPARSRVIVKLMAALLSGLLRRLTHGSSGSAGAGDGSGGNDDDGTAAGCSSGIAAARAAAISYVLAALLSKSHANGGGGLSPNRVAPTLLRFLLVNAARQGLMLPEPTTDGSETTQRPSAQLPQVEPFSPRPATNDLIRRSQEPASLRALPAGYARAWGDTPYNRGSGGLLEGRFSVGAGNSPTAPLVYRTLPNRTNPSPTAAKAGSPRETLPPWPLQRAFVHPHPPSSLSNPASLPLSYGRLVVELPGSPSGSPSSPGWYGTRPVPATTTGVGGGAGGGGGLGGASSLPQAAGPNVLRLMAVSGDGSPFADGGGGAAAAAAAGGNCGGGGGATNVLVLPPACSSVTGNGGIGSGGFGGGGGGRGFSQPPSPKTSGNLGSLGTSSMAPAPPRRPSSSGALIGTGTRDGIGGGGDGESCVTHLPALGRSASTGRYVSEDRSATPGGCSHGTASNSRGSTRLPSTCASGGYPAVTTATAGNSMGPTVDRTAPESSPTSGVLAVPPWAGPSAEALFVRLLAEVLRWLEAPSDDAPGADGATIRRAASGGWMSWLASQKVRLTSQMAQLENVMAAGTAAPALAVQQEQQGQMQQAIAIRVADANANGANPLRASDFGSTFLLTQQHQQLHLAGTSPRRRV